MYENIEALKSKFVDVFRGSGEGLRVFAAPGRVNLIGEHTDYNGGYVFPAALTLGTVIIARPRGDDKINLYAEDLELKVSADIDNLEAGKELKWGNYQFGVVDELTKARFNITGCDMLFYMDLPQKSGLSSSASIEVATATAIVTLGNEKKGLYNEPLDMIGIAVAAQKAEHNFIGVKCGIMDQFASAMGRKNHAIFLDCKTLKYKHVPFNIAGYRIIISNTNCKRSLAHSKYNERRAECESGLEALKQYIPEATCLGDVSLEQFEEYGDRIENPVVRNRTHFVISENDRVLKSIDALERNDVSTFGRFMIEAHESIRDLYEVTGRELDTIFEEELKVDGVIGARMTGAGFGGCTVSIVKEDRVADFIESVGRRYQDRIGIEADFYVCEIGDGGR